MPTTPREFGERVSAARATTRQERNECAVAERARAAARRRALAEGSGSSSSSAGGIRALFKAGASSSSSAAAAAAATRPSASAGGAVASTTASVVSAEGLHDILAKLDDEDDDEAEQADKATKPQVTAAPVASIASRFASMMSVNRVQVLEQPQAAPPLPSKGEVGSFFTGMTAPPPATEATGPLPSDLPTCRAEFPGEGEAVETAEVLHMFWIDAYEDARNNPGCLFLFGKVRVADGRFASCCVTVRNLQRCIFVLPRDTDRDAGGPVSMADVYKEVSGTLKETIFRKSEHQFAAKMVKRNYAFELPDIPREEHEYLKCVYPARFGPVPKEVAMGGRTFRRIFGGENPNLETFLLKRDIMGPCWLEIRAPVAPHAQVSWCNYEVEVHNPKFVNPLTTSSPSFKGEMLPPSPPLSVLSLSTKTVIEHKSHSHEVVLASGVFYPEVSVDGVTAYDGSKMQHFAAIRSPPGSQRIPVDFKDVLKADPGFAEEAVKVQSNERALLSYLISRIASLDPDIILGHNITGFDLDILLNRMVKHNLSQWSRIGRLRRKEMPRAKAGGAGRDTFLGVTTAGRLVCDTYRASQELVRQTSYGLTELTHELLGETRRGVEPVDVPRFYGSAADTLWLVKHTVNDAWLALKLAGHLQVLPLTKQLTNLAGNLWARSLKGARAERIEYLLLHEFHRLKFIVPDKFDQSRGKTEGEDRRAGGTGRKKPAYSGGLVLEPKKGLYDKYILLLDFNSLYPSIIQEFNICFTTVERPAEAAPASSSSSSKKARADDDDDDDDDDDGDAAPGGMEVPPLPSPSLPDGVLPRVIRTLVERRRQVKSALKTETDPTRRQQLDIRQKALKILANSMYGCLGFSNSRFYAKPLAALVTSQGREILQDTVNLAQDMLGLDVIYGDTDSIMVYTGSTDYETVMGVARKVVKEVNKKYRRLEIDIDGVFARMLLLKKKKYAALTIETPPDGDKPAVFKKEMKGLDIVRRDWCPLAKRVGEDVLDIVLSGREKDDAVQAIHAVLEQVGAALREGKVPLEEFIITKGLNKNPHDYPDKKGQPHLQVAMRMIQNGKAVNVGDHIPFVIAVEAEDRSTVDASSTPPKGALPVIASSGKKGVAERAHHPEELRRDASLKIDTDWYLSQQLLPVITRLCDPIEGTSPRQIAEALGIDASRFAMLAGPAGASLFDAEDNDYVPASVLSDEERFRTARHLTGRCCRCRKVSVIEGVLHSSETLLASNLTASGLVCPEPGCLGLLIASGGDTDHGMSPAGEWALSAVTAKAAVPVDERHLEGLPPMTCSVGRGMPHSQEEIEECRAALVNAVTQSVRGVLSTYMQRWFACDEGACHFRTRNVAVMHADHCLRPGCRGRLWPELSPGALHNQLEFLAIHLDVGRLKHKLHNLTKDPKVQMDTKMALSLRAIDDYPEHLAALAREAALEAAMSLERCSYHFVEPSVFAYVSRMQRREASKAAKVADDTSDDAIIVETF
jgi:DNA polymerase alpha subunit A